MSSDGEVIHDGAMGKGISRDGVRSCDGVRSHAGPLRDGTTSGTATTVGAETSCARATIMIDAIAVTAFTISGATMPGVTDAARGSLSTAGWVATNGGTEKQEGTTSALRLAAPLPVISSLLSSSTGTSRMPAALGILGRGEVGRRRRREKGRSAAEAAWGRSEDSTRLERLKEATAVDQLAKESLD